MSFFRETTKSFPLVRLEGVIRSGKLSLETHKEILDKTFSVAAERNPNKELGIILNSPGGSPTQSEILYNYIKGMKKIKNVFVNCFVEDAAASGGYYIASACDKIYCMENSIIGSVGVISQGFFLHKFIEHHNIEHFTKTAGEEKSRLNSFEEPKDEDMEWLSGVQKQMHETFKKHVLEGRKDKVKEKDLNGKIFIGKEAVNSGFVDGIKSPLDFVIENYKGKLKLYEVKENPWKKIFGKKSFSSEIMSTIQNHMAWNQYGLGGFNT